MSDKERRLGELALKLWVRQASDAEAAEYDKLRADLGKSIEECMDLANKVAEGN